MATTEQLLRDFGARLRELRRVKELSQEDLAAKCSLDRTYVSQVEGGRRNISLQNIQALALALEVPIAAFFEGTVPSVSPEGEATVYRANERISIACGFNVTGRDVEKSAHATAQQLQLLPFSLFKSVDLKTLSSIAGALFAGALAREIGAIVNPIEKGHPDILPRSASGASEERLRNYPEGLEVKVTVGNVKKGSDLAPGTPRIGQLTGITWQAHHREVEQLLGLVVDFAGTKQAGVRYPIVTGVFYADNLALDDWGAISGTTGRNTKVSGMRTSGKQKMGGGWMLLINHEDYIRKYSPLLGIRLV